MCGLFSSIGRLPSNFPQMFARFAQLGNRLNLRRKQNDLTIENSGMTLSQIGAAAWPGAQCMQRYM